MRRRAEFLCWKAIIWNVTEQTRNNVTATKVLNYWVIGDYRLGNRRLGKRKEQRSQAKGVR